MLENSHNITLSTYKELSLIEWFPGDEKMDWIMTDFEEELVYTAKKKKKTVTKVIKKKAVQRQMKTYKNCANIDQKLLKSC